MTDFDDALADRLLDGDIPADLDAALAPVAKVLAAARQLPADPGEPDASLVAALQAAVAGDVVDLTARRRRRTVIRTLVVAGIVGFGATSAAAATGSLPGPAQDVAHRLGRVVGMDIPERDAPPTTSGSQDGEGHGRSDEAPGRPEEPGQPADPNRSDEAPGQPEEVPTGVGQNGTPPGEGGTIPGTGETTPTTGPEGVPPAQDRSIPSTSVPTGDPGEGEPPPNPGDGHSQGGGSGAGQESGSGSTITDTIPDQSGRRP